jgi:hypothetical protein
VKPETDLSFKELEAGLAIDPNALDKGIIQQPDYFYRVARRLELALSQRDAAKKELEEIEAEVDQDIRQGAPSDTRVTEGDVKAQTRLDKRVRVAIRKQLELGMEVGKLSALKEAYRQRSYAFNQLNELAITGYFGNDVATGGHVKTVLAERAKRSMNNARRGYNNE